MKKNEGEFCVPRSLQENLVRRHQQRIDIDNNRSTSAKVPKQYSNEQQQNKKKANKYSIRNDEEETEEASYSHSYPIIIIIIMIIALFVQGNIYDIPSRFVCFYFASSF